MSKDAFASPKRRLGRAKQHIRKLDAGFARFFKKQPYVRVIELHTDGVSGPMASDTSLGGKLPVAICPACAARACKAINACPKMKRLASGCFPICVPVYPFASKAVECGA